MCACIWKMLSVCSAVSGFFFIFFILSRSLLLSVVLQFVMLSQKLHLLFVRWLNFCSCHKKSQKFLKSKRNQYMQFIFTSAKFHWAKFFSCCHILRKFFRLHNKCCAVLRSNKGRFDEITWGDFHFYGSLTAGIQ